MLNVVQGTNYSQGAAAAQAVLPTGAISFAADQQGIRMMQHPQSGQQYTIMQGGTYPGMPQGFMLVSAHGQQIPAGLGFYSLCLFKLRIPISVTVTTANLVHVPQRTAPVKSEPALQQLDGVAGILNQDGAGSSSGGIVGNRIVNIAQKNKKRILPQLDGAAGLSDSSEDDDVEDDDDDDDPLRRMVDRIGKMQ